MLTGNIIRHGGMDIIIDTYCSKDINKLKTGLVVKLSNESGLVEISDGKSACGILIAVEENINSGNIKKVSYMNKGVVYAEAVSGSTFTPGAPVYLAPDGKVTNKGNVCIGTAVLSDSFNVDYGSLSAVKSADESVVGVDLHLATVTIPQGAGGGYDDTLIKKDIAKNTSNITNLTNDMTKAKADIVKNAKDIAALKKP